MFTAAVRPGRVQCAMEVVARVERVRRGGRIVMIIVQLRVAWVWVGGVEGLLVE